MSAREDGGPAYPANELNGGGSVYAQHFGLTLRDYFAAKAMQATVSQAGANDISEPICALWAYKMADAMLAARGVAA